LVYRYVRRVVPAPLITLQGRSDRPRPLIDVTVIGPNATTVCRGVLDTAADDTVFPESAAQLLGLDLSQAPEGSSWGVGGQAIPLRLAEVTLRLASGAVRREWRAWVAFAAIQMRNALLGYAGCLQFFDTTFRGLAEEVELVPNASYPGT
jgi:hypothetical protein